MANAWLVKPERIIDAAVLQSSTRVGTPLNVDNDYAGVVWRSEVALYATPRIILQLRLQQDTLLDTVMLFGLAGASAATLVQVSAVPAAGGLFEGSVTTAAIQPLYAGAAMPASGFAVAALTLPLGYYRFVRLEFFSATGAEYVQVSRAVVGKRLQLERNFSFGAQFGVKDLGSVDFSRRGVLLRVRGAKLRTASLTFSNVRKDEVEATTAPLLQQLGNTDMVALLTDPTADAQRQSRAYFGPLVGDLGHTWRKANAFEAKINVVSLF